MSLLRRCAQPAVPAGARRPGRRRVGALAAAGALAAVTALSGLVPGIAAGAVAAGAVTVAVRPVTAVSVVGGQLVDQAGLPLQLDGVDHSGSEYACAQGWGIFDGPVDDTAITAMAGWHVRAVRVPLNEDCWLGINGLPRGTTAVGYRAAITGYVQRLQRHGMAVVLDLHWNAPGARPATGQQVMADADHAPAFWASVAGVFGHDPGVVFDLYNEPHDISWACWRAGCTTAAGWRAAGMATLLGAVRSHGGLNTVLLGGLGWAGDLSHWAAYAPVDPLHRLAASWHAYNFGGCTTPTCWTAMRAGAGHAPVVLGEFGETDCRSAFSTALMTWADAHAVSYLAWTWNTWSGCAGPSLLVRYDGTPNTFGAGVRAHLVGRFPLP